MALTNFLHIHSSPTVLAAQPSCDKASRNSLGSTSNIHPFLHAHPFLTYQSAHTQDPGPLPICRQLPCFLSTRWPAQRVSPMSTCLFHSNILPIFNNGNINNLRYADDTTLMAERKEKLKSLLMKVKEESEKAG